MTEHGTEASLSRDAFRGYWHPIAWASEIGRSPYSSLLLGERIVLWRDACGTLSAAADKCPHRGTALSLGSVDEQGRIICPYHGWHFSGAGACGVMPQLAPGATLPPRASLVVHPCEERYGIVWVCLDDPLKAIPAFPEWEDPSYRHVACAPYTWQTSAARMVENFTDFGHLGYLHDGLLGTRDDLVVPAHRVEHSAGELRYELTMTVPNTNDRFAVTNVAGERGLQQNTYVLTLPFAIHLSCAYLDSGAHRTLFFAAQPRGDGSCTGYCYQSRDFDLEGADGPYAAFQELLAEQDRPIVESQLPTELPLSPTAELQMPFDRVAVAYRRALAALIKSEAPANLSPSLSNA